MGSAMIDADDRPPSTQEGLLAVDLSASSAADVALIDPLAKLVDRVIAVVTRDAPLSGEVRIRLVRDPEMAAHHERHCGVPGTTDVLTFDLRDQPSNGPCQLDVDLMVCIDEAARQAALRSIPIEHELTLYILHGLLHVLGHDDHDDDEYRAMHAREDQILVESGLGPVFSTHADRESSL